MSNLIRLLGRRIVALPIMVLGVTLLVFIVMAFSTADPAQMALGESSSPEAREAWRTEHGLNKPLLVRFFAYLGGLVTGDLGQSFQGESINAMVMRNFPVTLQLTFIGLIVASSYPWSSASSPRCTATSGPTRSSVFSRSLSWQPRRSGWLCC